MLENNERRAGLGVLARNGEHPTPSLANPWRARAPPHRNPPLRPYHMGYLPLPKPDRVGEAACYQHESHADEAQQAQKHTSRRDSSLNKKQQHSLAGSQRLRLFLLYASGHPANFMARTKAGSTPPQTVHWTNTPPCLSQDCPSSASATTSLT